MQSAGQPCTQMISDPCITTMQADRDGVQAMQAQDQLSTPQQSLDSPPVAELASPACPTAIPQQPDVLALLGPWLAQLGQCQDSSAAAAAAQPVTASGLSHSPAQQPARQAGAGSAESAAIRQPQEANLMHEHLAWHPHLRQLAANRAVEPALPSIPVPPRPKPVKGEASKGGQPDKAHARQEMLRACCKPHKPISSLRVSLYVAASWCPSNARKLLLIFGITTCKEQFPADCFCMGKGWHYKHEPWTLTAAELTTSVCRAASFPCPLFGASQHPRPGSQPAPVRPLPPWQALAPGCRLPSRLIPPAHPQQNPSAPSGQPCDAAGCSDSVPSARQRHA